MTLKEMSKEYRAQAEVLRRRIGEVTGYRERSREEGERRLLGQRIIMLESMWREARDLAVITERYYERGYRRIDKYRI